MIDFNFANATQTQLSLHYRSGSVLDKNITMPLEGERFGA